MTFAGVMLLLGAAFNFGLARVLARPRAGDR